MLRNEGLLESPNSSGTRRNILEGLLSRSAVVLEKERLVYKAFYLPGVETLPASDFFREYLERLQSRFTALHTELRRRKQINVSTGNDG